MSRPCSTHVYQDSPTPASWATSSRRRPGVRRRPLAGRPTSCGVSCARRFLRKSVSSGSGGSLRGWWCESHDRCPSCEKATDRSAPLVACPTRHTPPSSAHTTVGRIGFGAMQLAGSGRVRPAARPRRRASPSYVAPSSSASTTSTRRSTTDRGRRQRAHPRGAAPVPRGPAPRDEGRRAPRGGRAAGCPHCARTSCARASRTTSQRSTSSG